jgi:Fe-S cluster assembly scaffold protein SufB
MGEAAHRPIDFQAISYFAAPKQKYASLDEVDPKLLETYDKLGVPLHERAKLAGVAVDAVFDSVSVGTTFRKELAEAGVIFCRCPKPSASIRNWCALHRQRGAARRQLFRRAQLGGVLRWQLRVHSQGRALPDGAEHLLPHQRGHIPASLNAP